MIIMKFRDRLKQLRNERGITQEHLSHALDIPASTIRRLESDEDSLPRKDRLEAIANYFNCSVDYLIGRTNNRTEIVEGIEDLIEFLTNPNTTVNGEPIPKELRDDLLGYVRIFQAKGKNLTKG